MKIKKASHKLPLYLGSLLVVVGALVSFHLMTRSYAEPVVGFNAGRIIDDVVFTHAGSMNAGQIQGFLNAKVPQCDTSGSQPSEYGGGTRAQWGAARGNPAPFICLKDYSENGRSAAQIIYDVSQEFQINPQVLLVLLQKEQGLVTDTWPLNSQYRTATGYGCPDSTPNVCNSSYYGFTNQLRWSGRMFRSIMNANPNWYTPYIVGNNYIQYSPNANCGGSTVNIENRATQALYNYTPYQPNQASLNAGYGSAPCGAYGNRNFYLYFNDWFGPTTTDCRTDEQPYAEIMRLYNPSTYKHFYTPYVCEVKTLTSKNGFSLEGVSFYQTNASSPYAVVVHRLYNPSTYQHLWATTQDDINNATQRAGYRYEGPTFYVVKPEVPRSVVVHRLYNPSTFKHLWVTTQDEINSATQRSGYRYEGPAFWAAPPPS